ncbi:Prefoldin subunit beta [uncultured archaeon]|nr:Prefoldin subunit beta [uncultured archaeon]
MQPQLQFSMSQRQQLSMQIEELKLAETELGKSEKGVYRIIGPILIETSKTEATADLKEKRDLFEMRVGVLAKQEEKLRPKLDELRAKLEKALRENRVSK